MHRFHNSGEAGWFMEPLDERVEKYLRKAIQNGCKRTKELKARGKEYVIETLFSNEKPPNPLRRRFFPNKKKLKNLIYSEKAKLKHSKIDQKNVVRKVELWKHTANVYFRPK